MPGTNVESGFQYVDDIIGHLEYENGVRPYELQESILDGSEDHPVEFWAEVEVLRRNDIIYREDGDFYLRPKLNPVERYALGIVEGIEPEELGEEKTGKALDRACSILYGPEE